MGFYYVSLFSLVPLGIAYGALALLFWGVVRATRGSANRRTKVLIVGIVFLILPISEELWIAWNYGQACKQAGTFVHKTVQVDGFYDDTRSTHTGEPNLQAVELFDKTGYRFLEMKGPNRGVVHLEKVDGQWRSNLFDRPTARYHYISRSNTPYSHKIVEHESKVVDVEENQVLGVERIYGRQAPWYFISLASPLQLCYGDRKVSGLIHAAVLIPKAQHSIETKK